MIVYQVVLFASLLVLYRGLALHANHDSDPARPFQLAVSPGPQGNLYLAGNLTLRCDRNANVPTKIAQIFRMRIVKKSLSGWSLVAEQRDNEFSPRVHGNNSASAHVTGDVSGAFLETTWDNVQFKNFGLFVCDVMGVDSRYKATVEYSSELYVDEFEVSKEYFINLSMETREAVSELKKRTEDEISALKRGFHDLGTNQSLYEQSLDTVEGRLRDLQSVGNKQRELESRLEKVERSPDIFSRFNLQIEQILQGLTSTKHSVSALEARHSSIQQSVSALETSHAALQHGVSTLETNRSSIDTRLATLETFISSLTQWPGGYYALLQPKTGCPVDLSFLGGTHKFHKFHTESRYSTSEDSHSSAFSPLTAFKSDKKNFVTLQFCEITKQFNTAGWPRGSYCIHKILHRPCPEGFNNGHVYMNAEDEEWTADGRNNVAKNMRNAQLEFCCLNTGSASYPVQLPTGSPFLLYRHGGVCQAVQGMRVSQEFLQVDTEDRFNADDVQGSVPDVDRPGTIMKFNLCYYTKV